LRCEPTWASAASQINSHRSLFLRSFLSLVDCFLGLSTVVDCAQAFFAGSSWIPAYSFVGGTQCLGVPSSPSYCGKFWTFYVVCTKVPITSHVPTMVLYRIDTCLSVLYSGARRHLGPEHIGLLTGLTSWNLNCPKFDRPQVDCHVEIVFSLQESNFSPSLLCH